jgi:endonuclease/exonuclease/phosphatase family metal-dependent hydrolase
MIVLKYNLFIGILCLCFYEVSAVSLISWNIKDLGGTKSNEEIELIARVVRDYDIVAIQEVVAKDPAGAKAVARLADQLNRMGSKWDYRVSDPTKSPSAYISERYAFLWKTSKVVMQGRPRLMGELVELCDREPYYARFVEDGTQYDVINFHSRPHNKNPQSEVEAISRLVLSNQNDYNWIVAGDFNMSEEDDIWGLLYSQSYRSSLMNQKTTLKTKCAQGEYLNYPIDNIYFNKKTMLLTLLV